MSNIESSKNPAAAGVRYTVIAILVVVLVILLGFMNKLSKPRVLNEHELRAYGAYLLSTPRKVSPFKLTDHRGHPFTDEQLQGKWTMIFFGFTHCPDICPTTLAVLSKMYQELDSDEMADLQVVMVSLDPERDSLEKLAQYVPYFHQDFLGVAADKYVLLKLATELNVAYTKAPLTGASVQADDYTIDHSGNIILMNPKGHFHGYLRPPFEHGSMRVAWRSIR